MVYIWFVILSTILYTLPTQQKEREKEERKNGKQVITSQIDQDVNKVFEKLTKD